MHTHCAGTTWLTRALQFDASTLSRPAPDCRMSCGGATAHHLIGAVVSLPLAHYSARGTNDSQGDECLTHTTSSRLPTPP